MSPLAPVCPRTDSDSWLCRSRSQGQLLGSEEGCSCVCLRVGGPGPVSQSAALASQRSHPHPPSPNIPGPAIISSIDIITLDSVRQPPVSLFTAAVYSFSQQKTDKTRVTVQRLGLLRVVGVITISINSPHYSNSQFVCTLDIFLDLTVSFNLKHH